MLKWLRTLGNKNENGLIMVILLRKSTFWPKFTQCSHYLKAKFRMYLLSHLFVFPNGVTSFILRIRTFMNPNKTKKISPGLALRFLDFIRFMINVLNVLWISTDKHNPLYFFQIGFCKFTQIEFFSKFHRSLHSISQGFGPEFDSKNVSRFDVTDVLASLRLGLAYINHPLCYLEHLLQLVKLAGSAFVIELIFENANKQQIFCRK